MNINFPSLMLVCSRAQALVTLTVPFSSSWGILGFVAAPGGKCIAFHIFCICPVVFSLCGMKEEASLSKA